MGWREHKQFVDTGSLSVVGTADVVVVGVGYAGASVVRAAAEKGASVIGIEVQKEERYRLFGRDVGHINSCFLRSRGVPDVDPLDLFNEWMRRAGNRANPKLVMQFCTHSGGSFDWFSEVCSTKDLHVAFWPEGGELFHKASTEGRSDINGYHFWTGTAEYPDPMGWKGEPELFVCAKKNIDRAVENGAKMFWNTRALQLEKAEGRVVGVVVELPDGSQAMVRAERGVVLAAGDFSGNREMVEELCCDITDSLTPDQTMPRSFGRDGSGIRMGLWAGGRLESRPLPAMCGTGVSLPGPCTYAGLWLDHRGKRFCNELFGGTEISGYAASQSKQGDYYCVFDEHYVEHEVAWATPSHGGLDVNSFGNLERIQTLIAMGKSSQDHKVTFKTSPPIRMDMTVYCGKTPEELALHAGLSGEVAENLVFEIHRYNELCALRRDEDFGRDERLLDPLDGMLFLYKVQTQPMGQLLVSVGGLVTNDEQQVLDNYYDPVPGLYATGNCCGRRFGPQYSTPIPGISIGMAITLGKILGESLATK